MEATLATPTIEEQQAARASLAHFPDSAALDSVQLVFFSPQRDEEAITLPRKALELLRVILASMAEGQAISLLPANAELSTQQAADMLNVSRPHLVKLLEQGALPFKKAGSHRRVLLTDLVQYEARQARHREHQLQQLAQQAQELALGYE